MDLTTAGAEATRVMATYGDLSQSPRTTPNRVMVVGTGGLGLWERSWYRWALGGEHYAESGPLAYELYRKGADVRGVMRAMCFATDVSAPAFRTVRDHGQGAFRHTDTARRQKTRFDRDFERAMDKYRAGDAPRYSEQLTPEQIEQIQSGLARMRDEVESRQRVYATVDAFVERVGEGWQTRFAELERFCSDGVELGKHILMLGLVRDNHAMAAQGILSMSRAAVLMEEAMYDACAANVACLPAGAVVSGSPSGREFVVYRRAAVGHFLPFREPDRVADADYFLAESLVSHAARTFYRSNAEHVREAAENQHRKRLLSADNLRLFKYERHPVFNLLKRAIANDDVDAAGRHCQVLAELSRSLRKGRRAQ